MPHPLIELYRRSPLGALAAFREGQRADEAERRCACAEGGLVCDHDAWPVAARRGDDPALISIGDPLPSDPGAVLAHFVALDELLERNRARAYEGPRRDWGSTPRLD